jgi:hypothetical protein
VSGESQFLQAFVEAVNSFEAAGQQVTIAAIPQWNDGFEAYFVITKPGTTAEAIAEIFSKNAAALDAHREADRATRSESPSARQDRDEGEMK